MLPVRALAVLPHLRFLFVPEPTWLPLYLQLLVGVW
jgi:hypothetical protein